jgi:oxygen-independent coproporphyrinogen III oxidase
MESYFELVVERLTDAGYRWYETANFCRAPDAVGGRDLRAQHNLAYWLGKDYLGVGVGAVSTIENRRWRNTPRVAAYLGALGRRERPDRELEPLSETVRREERVMLGLRLDQPLPLAPVVAAVDTAALARMERLGLASVGGRPDEATVSLTRRGRLLGGGVTAEILA